MSIRFRPRDGHVECEFDLVGYGSGVIYLSPGQAETLAYELETSISIAKDKGVRRVD